MVFVLNSYKEFLLIDRSVISIIPNELYIFVRTSRHLLVIAIGTSPPMSPCGISGKVTGLHIHKLPKDMHCAKKNPLKTAMKACDLIHNKSCSVNHKCIYYRHIMHLLLPSF